MSDWKARAKASSAVVNQSDWRQRALVQSRTLGPDETNIDTSEDAPALIRMQVGALDKPEDRLKALQQTYPDAKPYGEDNFIYTDNGKTRLYNEESWFPSLGDIASIAPELSETAGSMVGGLLGGIGGGVAGSAVPVVGTGVGAVGGAMTGAGVGGTLGRETAQRSLNYLFGSDDTRTGKEQLVDGLQTFGINMAGEGVGRAAAKGIQLGKDAWNTRIIGGVDDVAKAQQRVADWEKIGVNPTAGMISGNQKTSVLEHAIGATRSGDEINKRVADAYRAQDDEFGRIVGGISDRPLSVAEAGEALQKQAELAKEAGFARSEQLYDDVAAKITSPAVVDSTSGFLQGLAAERAAYGQFDNLTRGAQADKVLEQAKAILSDAGNGMSFDKLKQARTYIGQIAADSDDKVLKNHLNGLYASLTSDMEKTAAASGDDALQAFRKANNQFRRMVDPEKGFGKGSTASTLLAKDSDQLLEWSLQQGKSGGNRIAQVRRTVQRSEGGNDAWNQVIAGVTDRLGRGTDDAFDSGVFMRNWNKMSEEAKDALFKGTANAQYRKDLDTLARIGDNFTKYRRGANHSNTENHRAAKDSLNPFSKDNAVISFLGLATTAEPVTAMALGAAKGGAVQGASRLTAASRSKLLTSPETVAWMAQLPKAEMQKGGIRNHFKKLVNIARGSKDNLLAAAIDEYLKDLNYEQEQEAKSP